MGVIGGMPFQTAPCICAGFYQNLGMSATATVRGVPRPLLYKRLALRAYDILVTTPDSLLALLQERRVSLRRVAHVVVDEVCFCQAFAQFCNPDSGHEVAGP